MAALVATGAALTLLLQAPIAAGATSRPKPHFARSALALGPLAPHIGAPPSRKGAAVPLTPPAVPQQYQQLYAALSSQLAGIGSSGGNQSSSQSQPALGAKLPLPTNLEGLPVRMNQSLSELPGLLDDLASLGVKVVTLAVPFPSLAPSFPKSHDYLLFYEQVAQDVHAKGLKLAVEMPPLFADTPLAGAQFNYPGLDSPESYATAKASMAEIVIRDLAPQYLTLEGPADTTARLVGLSALNDPATYAKVVSEELSDIHDAKSVELGAGPGSWSDPQFFKDLASTGINYISVEVETLDPSSIADLQLAANIAASSGKQVMIGGAWLFKGTSTSPGSAAAASAIPLNFYSFWYPLDVQFLQETYDLATSAGYSVVTVSWTPLLFSYLNYKPSYDSLPFDMLLDKLYGALDTALSQNNLSPTGLAFEGLSS